MLCLLGIDDTDSSRGSCTTHLAFRIACDLKSALRVLPYPRLVRLNPNIPFKTRGNASVCLRLETPDPPRAFSLLTAKLSELSDVEGGANSGLVFLEDLRLLPWFRLLYHDALSGVVNQGRVRRFLTENRVRFFTLGNGMGVVGAAASLGFDGTEDHTYELIAYRRRESWGKVRRIDGDSVREMDRVTFPHTFNSYDYQKRKVLISPHGPDPVFAGVRGDSVAAVSHAFGRLSFSEALEGYMVFLTNQHTDAHLRRRLDWKVFSSGWTSGTVRHVETGPGGHVYVETEDDGVARQCAFYEPTGDLRRVARRLAKGDGVRLSGGVRKGTTAHSKVLNVERMEVTSLVRVQRNGLIMKGTYISSPRANRHLTKPLIRYGREPAPSGPRERLPWLRAPSISRRGPARSR